MQGYYFKLASYAFHSGCSFIGAKPLCNVLYGYRGQLAFLFRKNNNSNFYTYLLNTYPAHHITVKSGVSYKGKIYTLFLVPVSFRITRKFLYSFFLFCKHSSHYISIFS